ncbi:MULTISPECIES: hypothetical protein [Grimontia]|uniref:Uncharacterized protein n=1 Tax=Grimontia marina TaxID=646534 RepID=A0A128EW78_9GAMM|nr:MULTISPECIES: hypothetical protein [Grimontia]WRV96987.1 hypothetical protein VP504_13040 [Grimontia sp. NTOU-MAR1]CZF78450.1 hypothetical protein GMA8713_00580 [Grimontia marina]
MADMVGTNNPDSLERTNNAYAISGLFGRNRILDSAGHDEIFHGVGKGIFIGETGEDFLKGGESAGSFSLQYLLGEGNDDSCTIVFEAGIDTLTAGTNFASLDRSQVGNNTLANLAFGSSFTLNTATDRSADDFIIA